jgi:hypothetical protein
MKKKEEAEEEEALSLEISRAHALAHTRNTEEWGKKGPRPPPTRRGGG